MITVPKIISKIFQSITLQNSLKGRIPVIIKIPAEIQAITALNFAGKKIIKTYINIKIMIADIFNIDTNAPFCRYILIHSTQTSLNLQ